MQSKLESLLENVYNVGSGFITALLVWAYVVKPLYDIEVSAAQNLEITFIFTVVSVLRGYIWRRVFNRLALRKHKNNKETFHEAARHNG